MYSVKVEYKIYCDICNQHYLDRNYKNHLKSQGHINNFIKKRKVTSVILTDKICNTSHLTKFK